MATAPGLSISSGIGTGAAQVFSSAPLLNAIQQKSEEIKRRRQELDKNLQDQIQDIDIDGIRDADSDAVIEGYNELIDMYSDIASTEDMSSRIRKEADFNKAKGRLMGLVNRSLETKEFEKELSRVGLNTPVNQLSDSFASNLSTLRSKPVTDPEISKYTDFALYQRKPKPVDLQSVMNGIAKQSSRAYRSDFSPAGFGLVEREEGTKLDYDTFKSNMMQKAIQDDDFSDQLLATYEPIFNSRSEADVIKEMAEAESLGIEDYNPESIDDFIALQNFKTRVGTTEFERSSSTVRSMPKPKSSAGGSDISFSYKPISSDTKGEINVTINGQPTDIPVSKSTPYTKSFNVNVGSDNNTYWDVENGGWADDLEAGAYRFQASEIVDVPFAIEAGTGLEKIVTKSVLPSVKEGNNPNVSDAYYRPMIIGNLDVPVGGVTVEKRVMIPLEQFPTNVSLSKNDAATLRMHSNGGGRIPVSKDNIGIKPKVSPATKLTPGFLDNVGVD